MIRRLIFSLSLLLFATATFAQGDANQVKRVYEQYKEAITNGQGERTATLVDDRTITYYEDLLTLGLTASKETLQQTTLTDQMTVLYLRHKVPAGKLRSMDGRALFIYAVNEKMVGSNISQIQLGDISVNGDQASAPLSVNGIDIPASLKFYRADNSRWVIDITSLMSIAEQGLEMMRQSSGKAKDEFVSQMIKMTTQREDIEALWQPVGM